MPMALNTVLRRATTLRRATPMLRAMHTRQATGTHRPTGTRQATAIITHRRSKSALASALAGTGIGGSQMGFTAPRHGDQNRESGVASMTVGHYRLPAQPVMVQIVD